MSSGGDGHVRVWDGATGEQLCAQKCDGSAVKCGVSGSAGAWVLNVGSVRTTVDGQPAIRYLASGGKHVLTGVLISNGGGAMAAPEASALADASAKRAKITSAW